MPYEFQHRVLFFEKIFVSKVKALTSAPSVTLSLLIASFVGGLRKFKQLIKEVAKCGVMSRKQGPQAFIYNK